MARPIKNGLKLSFNKSNKQWYKSFREGGKSKRKYFGTGKGISDRVSYRAALPKYEQWKTERELGLAMRHVMERMLAVENGEKPVEALKDTPAERMYSKILQQPVSDEVKPIHELTGDELAERMVEPDSLADLAVRRLLYSRASANRKAPAKKIDTANSHIDRWSASERLRAQAGQISDMALRSKIMGIRTFREFAGEESLEDPERVEQLLMGYRDMLLIKLTSGEYTANTVNDKLKFAKQFIGYAYEHRVLKEQPRTLASFVKRLPVVKCGKPLPIDQVMRIWEAASDRMKCFIALGLNCGFKNSDIASLKGGMIEGDRLIGYRQKTLKHQVPMNYKLWPITLELIEKCRDNHGPDELIFTNQKGDAIAGGTITALFKKVSTRAKVVVGKNKKGKDAYATFEQLRDTSSELIRGMLLKNGDDLGLLQVFLAHKDSSTAAYYTTNDPKALQTDKLDQLVADLAMKYAIT